MAPTIAAGKNLETPSPLTVNLLDGGNSDDTNFGYVEPNTPPTGSIGDTVWADTNSNGVQDNGEPGIPDVIVTLKLNNVVVATTTTDANGKYLFTGLAAGTYTVSTSGSALTGLVETYDLDGVGLRTPRRWCWPPPRPAWTRTSATATVAP